MKMKSLLFGALLACGAIAHAQENTITVQTKKLGAEIQSTMYGVFFEDINYGADGGLYAELIKNRSFEFAPDHFMGWDMFGNVTLKNDGPFDKNPHYVSLGWSGHGDMWTGMQNEGFFGIGLKENAEYRFSVWARVPDGKPCKLRVQFIDQYSMDDNQQFVSQDLDINSKEWKKYTMIMKSNRTIADAKLRIFLVDARGRNAACNVDLEHVSLFPVDTWMGHENGMRKDLMQALYDMRPGVFRFPGGCIVEGATLETRYQWKNSVGPVENRPLNKNRWESTFTHRYYPDYFQSYGLGFYEYFLLSEELGAAPLPVLNVGMACQFQNQNEAAHAACTKEGMMPYVQDAFDLIEFANGSTDTKWGKLRAEMGHPEPFNMKYLGIGNEQWDKFYFDRLAFFVDTLRKVHPEILIIGTSGPDSEGRNFEIGWEDMKKKEVDLVDEHFYRNIDWFKNSMYRYDDYDRTGPKVFAGEYACHDHGNRMKWNHAGASIYEAAFMTTIERNADIVHMATYAPLFAHVKGWQWRPDLIWFDNLNSVKSVSYYVQQMYAKNMGTNVLTTTFSNPAPKGQDGIFTSAVFDKNTNEYIVKVINTTEKAEPITINFEGAKAIGEKVNTITLNCSDFAKDNTLDDPNAITPIDGYTTSEGTSIKATVGGKCFVVYKVKKVK